MSEDCLTAGRGKLTVEEAGSIEVDALDLGETVEAEVVHATNFRFSEIRLGRAEGCRALVTSSSPTGFWVELHRYAEAEGPYYGGYGSDPDAVNVPWARVGISGRDPA